MKKIAYLAIVALAFVACTSENGANQVVRIAVSLEEDQTNQTTQQRISAIDKGSTEDGHGIIDIKWEEGDKLYYDKTDLTKNVFEVESISEDGKNAIFVCSDFNGDYNFSLYYQGKDSPDFSNPTAKFFQTVNVNVGEDGNYEYSINNDYLIYSATDCKIGGDVNFEPDFTILGVQVNGTFNFDKYLAIGDDYKINAIYSKPNRSVDLTKAPIFYFVLPNDADFLQNKSIWVAQSSEDGLSLKHSLSSITLDPDCAKIIRLTLTELNEGEGSTTNERYKIAKL